MIWDWIVAGFGLAFGIVSFIVIAFVVVALVCFLFLLGLATHAWWRDHNKHVRWRNNTHEEQVERRWTQIDNERENDIASARWAASPEGKRELKKREEHRQLARVAHQPYFTPNLLGEGYRPEDMNAALFPGAKFVTRPRVRGSR